MQRGSLALLAFGTFVVAAIGACSGDGSTPTLPAAGPSSSVAGNQPGRDTSHRDTTAGKTSNGPVATVQVTPQSLAIMIGARGTLTAVGLDADGVVVPSAKASWKVLNTAVASVDTGGVVTGLINGATLVTATIDGHSASAQLIVLATRDTIIPPPPVASFDYMGTVKGLTITAERPDSTKGVLLAGAVVRMLRTQDLAGHPLPSVVEGSATTGADGVVFFKGLPGGQYRVEVTPPANSPYKVFTPLLDPPRTQSVVQTLWLFNVLPVAP